MRVGFGVGFFVDGNQRKKERSPKPTCTRRQLAPKPTRTRTKPIQTGNLVMLYLVRCFQKFNCSRGGMVNVWGAELTTRVRSP